MLATWRAFGHVNGWEMAFLKTNVSQAADDLEFDIRHYSVAESFRRVWPLVRPHRWRLALAAALVACVGMAVAVGPAFTKYVIDTAIPQKNIRLARR